MAVYIKKHEDANLVGVCDDCSKLKMSFLPGTDGKSTHSALVSNCLLNAGSQVIERTLYYGPERRSRCSGIKNPLVFTHLRPHLTDSCR